MSHPERSEGSLFHNHFLVFLDPMLRLGTQFPAQQNLLELSSKGAIICATRVG